MNQSSLGRSQLEVQATLRQPLSIDLTNLLPRPSLSYNNNINNNSNRSLSYYNNSSSNNNNIINSQSPSVRTRSTGSET